MSALLGARELVPDYIPYVVTHRGRHRGRAETQGETKTKLTTPGRHWARITEGRGRPVRPRRVVGVE